MSITQDKWNEKKCWSEYGIFFSNDECILLEGESENCYVASARIPVSSLIENDADDGWTHLYPLLSCRTEKDGFIVLGGETSWEGDGFIALIDAASNNLVWVMHLCQSETFVEVGIDGENILATSEEYPHSYSWEIPLNNPEKLRGVVTRNQANQWT